MNLKITMHKWIAAWVCLLLTGFSACDYIHDELEPCKHYLSFSYTYNMKYADAFAHEMTNQFANKTLRLYIYDGEGRFLRSEQLEGEALRANRYELNLTPGTYRLLAWAGLNETDYDWGSPATGAAIGDFQMSVKRDDRGAVARELLGLFQGEMTLEIPEGHSEHVMPLVKNTNKIRFVIVDANRGTSLTADGFNVVATTQNGDLSHDNQPLSDTRLTWKPYYQGVETVQASDGAAAYQAVCAELNTLRLMDGSDTRLQLRYASEAAPFFDVRLTDFLLLTKMESHDLAPQEYLDRQDEYVVLVYVDTVGGKAHCLEVIVNDWVVRLDDLTLGKEG